MDWQNQAFDGNHALFFCRDVRRSTHFCLDSGNSESSSNPRQDTGSTTGSESPSVVGDSSPLNVGSGSVISTTKGKITISADPQVSAAAFATIQDVVNQALTAVGLANQSAAATVAQQANATGDSNATLTSVLGAVLGRDQSQAASVASGGQTDTNKTILYVVGAAFGGLALILIFKK